MLGLIYEFVCLFLQFLAVGTILGVAYFGFVFVIAWCHDDPHYFAVRFERFMDFIDDAFDRVGFAFLIFVCAVVGVFQVLTFLRV